MPRTPARQILRASGRRPMPHLHQGAIVLARNQRWRIEEVRPHEGCTLVALAGDEPANAGQRRSLLSPFDEIEPITRRTKPTRVSLQRWRGACRALVAAAAPPGGLRTAGAAAIDLFSHQLVPALAVIRGLGARVLLADDVGLGKTVQAGLIVAELRARGAADRVLILTPAGLRDQWQQELRDRVALGAEIVDAALLRHLVARLPFGVNPWLASPVAIASIDYVKRGEVLPALRSCLWDVLIVDEAHAVAGDTNRRHAVEALARGAVFIVLLSATPHNGNSDAFAQLCRIGVSPREQPMLLFRRTRADVALPSKRRVRQLSIRLSSAERRMHMLLARFVDLVAAERGEAVRLLAAVLQKRACSSPWSLGRSVERRLEALAVNGCTNVSGALQLALPLDSAGELNAEDDVPPWHPDVHLNDPRREREVLEELAAAAAAAAGRESKLAAVARLLRRAAEPAIVFTEYRDTLVHISSRLPQNCALLHGGLGRRDRAAALKAFADGNARVLLATDAAGEGLNLQERCRFVVNIELPWNPMRLEQRIGRVDRIGQRRTVHVVHLVARGTIEPNVLQRLRGRVSRAQREVGAANPLAPVERLPDGVNGEEAASSLDFRRIDLEPDAAAEAARLASVRRRVRSRDAPQADFAPNGPWLARSRRTPTRAALRRRALTIYQATLLDDTGRSVEATLAGTWTPTVEPQRYEPAVTSHLATWQSEARSVHERFVSCRLIREQARCDSIEARGSGRELQPGLFDRRAVSAQAVLDDEVLQIRRGLAARIAALEAARRVAVDIQPVLILVP